MRLPWRVAALTAILVAALTASACTVPRGGGSLGSAVAPPNGSLFGSYEMPVPGASDRASYTQQVEAKERFNGRVNDVFHYFYGWSASIPSWREQWALDGGRTPMISWAGPVVSSITNGSQDAHIDQRARALRDLRRPVLLRFFWEPDARINVGRSQDPATYRAAWRRLHQRFQAAGATNVEFVWSPTADGFRTGEAPKWYPGDDVVDWIAADGYNWYPRSTSGRANWRSFSDIFTPFYAWAENRPKPLMVAEMGLQEDPSQSGRKAAWIRDMAAVLPRSFPRIKAVVYFNGDGGRQIPWFVESSTSARTAWRDIGQTSHLRTR